MTQAKYSEKSQGLAIVLAYFFGWIGTHQYYLGNTKRGLAYTITFWTFVPLLVSMYDGIQYVLNPDWFSQKDSKVNGQTADSSTESDVNETGTKSKNETDLAENSGDPRHKDDATIDNNQKDKMPYKYKFTAHMNSHNLQSTDNSRSTSTDLSEQFSSTDPYEVTIDDSSIRIYDGAYQIDFDEIAEVQEFEDGATVSGPEGTYETKTVGIKMATSDSGELRIHEHHLGPAPAPELAFSEEISQYVQQRVKELSTVDLPYEYSLCDRLKIERPDLKVEGWTDGSSDINADIDASASSKGKSKGIEIGPFTRSKTSSNSSIDGNISGDISDNTYTTKINSFKLYDEYLSIDSDVKLDLYYSDIKNVSKHDGGGMTKKGGTLVKPGDGVIIQAGPTTFRIEDLSPDAPIDEGIDFIKSKMKNEQDKIGKPDESENKTDTEKLREIKDLYEDGILNEEEFESKKQELLDNL